MMIIRCLLIFWVVLTATSDGAETLAGKVTKLDCAASPLHSYTLYLPSGYDPARRWPLLLAFDPSAEGERPVNAFREAAERYGYIVAASNESRNYSPWAGNLAAAAAVWQDVSTRFSVEPERVYTTGFSGGARVALEVALQTESVAGVFVHGGGFREREHLELELPFVLVGAAGNQDMNLREIEQMHDSLVARGWPSRRLIFKGGHRWAPAETIERALAWFELQAFRKGSARRDPEWLEQQYELALRETRSLGDSYAALLEYEQQLRDFEGLVGLEPSRAERRRLIALPSTRRERKAVEKRQRVEDRRRQELAALMKQVERSVDDDLAQRAAFRRLAVTLKGIVAEQRSSVLKDVAMANRLLLFVSTVGFEWAEIASSEQRWREAEGFFRVGLLAAPEEAELHFRLAECYARQRKMPAAWAALQAAVDLGFDSIERLSASAALRRWHENESYISILKQLQEDQGEATDSLSQPPN
jgi:dienelactone hydrolase